MERKDLLTENGKIFVAQGRALSRVASRQVRVLIVGNPCNTNCLIALHHAPHLSPSQFHAMSRLDQHRAAYQLALKAKVHVAQVTHMAIWGNHSSTQVPDFFHAKIGGRPATQLIEDQNWLRSEFLHCVQKRGAEVIAMRGKSSAASAAHAALYSMRALWEKSGDDWFSACVLAKDNRYAIREDLVFSFPCRSQGDGNWQIVTGLSFDPFLREKLAITEKELMQERDEIRHLLRDHS
jgi:malate dehydrogenase